MEFRCILTHTAVLALLPFANAGFCSAQGVVGDTSRIPPLPPRENVPCILTFLSPLLLPKLVQDEVRLKEYIRSGKLAADKGPYNDLFAVDLIFDRALRLSWNNVFEALFISFLAVMDHDRFGVRLPVVGIVLWFPLTSEFRGEYEKRIEALPRRLYRDSPTDKAGDRDKLQHFFGSALLTYMTESAESAERLGDFVEWGEDEFIVGGVSDDRDVQANRNGQRFGIELLANPAARPSASFRSASLAAAAAHSVRHVWICIPWEAQ
jgi:hypothetical protein